MSNIFVQCKNLVLLTIFGLLFFVPLLVFGQSLNAVSASAQYNSNCSSIQISYQGSIDTTLFSPGDQLTMSISELAGSGGAGNMLNTSNVSLPANGLFSGQQSFSAENINQLFVQLVVNGNTFSQIVSVDSCQQSDSDTNTSTNTNTNTTTSTSESNSQSGGSNFSAGSEEAVNINNPISVNSIPEFIKKALELIIKIGIPLLVIMIVYSGAMYILAAGNATKLEHAHDSLLYTLVGGAILLGAWALAQLIQSTLIDLTAFIPNILV